MIPNWFRARYREFAAPPLILAHRGDSFRGPENTLEAAKLGLEAGADGWELDVHLTRDRIPVVIHDESLSRTTDVARRFEGDRRAGSGYRVGDFLWEEIRQLDAGSWFVDPVGGPRSAAEFGTLDRLAKSDLTHYRSGQVRIPTLAQALGWTSEVDWLVNIEIKPAPEDRAKVVDLVLGVIRANEAIHRVTLSSFDHPTVAMVSEFEPGVATGLLIAESLNRPALQLLEEYQADAIHASVSCCFPEKPGEGWTLLGETHPVDIPVLVYTVNEFGPLGLSGRLAEAGAAGWFTDDPKSCREGASITPSEGRTRVR